MEKTIITNLRSLAKECRVLSRNLQQEKEEEARELYRRTIVEAEHVFMSVFRKYKIKGRGAEDAKDAIDEVAISADLLYQRFQKKFKMKQDWRKDMEFKEI